jgi:hypothetical protein
MYREHKLDKSAFVGMDLHVFMNHATPTVEALPIWRTLHSFFAAFGRSSVQAIRVYSHSYTFFLDNREIIRELEKQHEAFEFYTTRGLADGYAQSIRHSSAEFVFQLEHDWLFQRDAIRHSLVEITSAMRSDQLPNLRFNQFTNATNGGQTVSPMTDTSLPTCRSSIFSNNPHILNRAMAEKMYLPLINPRSARSSGIEEVLTRRFGEAWLYGPLNHPATIAHSDGARPYLETRGVLRNRLRLKRYTQDLMDAVGISRYGRLH